MEDEKNLEKKKKWTVLIYQAADNNLTEESVFALKEMKKLGTIKKKEGGVALGEEVREVDILVQLDPSGRGNQTLRLRIGKGDEEDGELDKEADEIVKIDETDTGARKTLIDFLCFGIKKYPADFYMVILSGHGSGTDQDFFLRDENRPVSLIPSSLGIPDLEQVFAKGKEVDKALEEAKLGRKINILGFDACLMSMAEVCYQLRGSLVELMIGSEGFSPNAGWPLQRVLKILKNKTDIEPEKLARRIVNRYTRFYVNYELGGLSVDISVLRIERIEELKKKVEELVAVLKRKLDESLAQRVGGHRAAGRGERMLGKHYKFPRPAFIDAIIMSHWEAQSYNGEQFVDLFDFCDILRQRYPNPKGAGEDKSVSEACLAVMNAIAGKKDPVVLHSCYNGPAYQYSYGVSIYFPWSCTEFSTHYFHHDEETPEHQHIDFPKDSNWGEFLMLYFKATILRPPRRDAESVAEADVRSGPPASRGPNARVRSMRNPTPYYFKSPCAKREPEGGD